jgi:CHAT domain-containing protein
LHFDVHGVLDEKRPELSGLALSMVRPNGSSQEGLLRLHEIANLRLQADLVVLGSCRSSLGREVRGEGLMALTRGFFYAGASAVVASLWNVDDEASADLMKSFYQGIFGPARLRPAAALRQAQLATLGVARWRDPYYWASYALQGLEVKQP